eukprot:PLAT8395.1.p1 GENE.PLAT8395.1~~PLAT8395.1.p1  ORF type:complete len:398 (+),score=164.97 PLAT8395.1:1425-2618(+)
MKRTLRTRPERRSLRNALNSKEGGLGCLSSRRSSQEATRKPPRPARPTSLAALFMATLVGRPSLERWWHHLIAMADDDDVALSFVEFGEDGKVVGEAGGLDDWSGDSDGSFDSEDEAEVRRIAGELFKSKMINNTELMDEALEEMKQDKSFVDTLCITGLPLELEESKAQDNLARELAFYTQSLEAARLGRRRLEKAGVPYRRPDDYFAEMVKTDKQMARVKQKLVLETRKIAAVEARKRKREEKKFMKQVQSESVKQRAAEKRETLDAIARWKRKHGTLSRDDEEKMLNIISTRKRKRDAAEARRGGKAEKGRKRRYKDAKFGFGGKRNRRNDGESAADMSDYRPSRKALPVSARGSGGGRRGGFGGRRGGRGGGRGGSARRPGKSRRAAARRGRS